MAVNDNIQHGIDDNPAGDAEKGAALGGLGGVAVGAAAGSLAGPLGAVVGAVAGGLLGAGASGAAVAAVDSMDNDNTVSGVGSGVTPSLNTPVGTTIPANTAVPAGMTVPAGGTVPVNPTPLSGTLPLDPTIPVNTYDSSLVENVRSSDDAPVTGAETVGGHNIVTGEAATTEDGNTGLAAGAVVGGLIGTAVGGPIGAVVGGTVGSLAGGVAGDAAEAAGDDNAIEEGASTYKATTTPTLGNVTPSPIVHTGPNTPTNLQ